MADRQILDQVQPLGGGTQGVTSVAMTGDGTVYNASVPGSPITGAGTLAPTLHTQSANLVFAGPTSGGAVAPTFRSLVAADIPSLSGTYLPLTGGTMTGAIALPNGSAAAPSLAFNTNYGFYYDSVNSAVAIDVAGTEVMYVGTSQIKANLTTAPAAGGNVFWVNETFGTLFNGTTTAGSFAVSGTSGGSSTLLYGLTFSATLSGSTATDGSATGISGSAFYSGSGTTSIIQGGTLSARMNGTGTISTAEGCQAQNFISNASGKITTNYTYLASSPSITAGGTITTAYGLFVNAHQITGVTTGYGIYVAGTTDINIIAGKLSVGTTTTPTTTLNIVGNIGISNVAVIDANANILGGAYAPGYQKVTPTTGFSQTINNNVGALILTPAGTLSTGTVTMPATPVDGQEILLQSSQTITTLTVLANTGQTLLGTITTIAANGFARWKYVSSTTTWYRAG